MRFLIIDHYYPSFLESFYKGRSGLARQPYVEQWRTIMAQCFGTADFYSSNLKKLGHEAEEVVANCRPMQMRWARENNLQPNNGLPHFRVRRIKGVPVPHIKSDGRWRSQVLLGQIKSYKPDVLYIQDMISTEPSFLQEARPYAGIIVGQHATWIPKGLPVRLYDLVVSSLPNVVSFIRDQGGRAEYLRLGFEASLLKRLPEQRQPLYDVGHVGGYGPIHAERNALLEYLARHVKVDFWGYGEDRLQPASPVRRNFHGEAWGLGMYRVRQASRIVVSKHIASVAGPWANLMTLYEATGLGSLLVIDQRRDLSSIFELGKEVVAYIDAQDCVEKVRYYLEHEEERLAIAQAGHRRTLQEHTYYHRMQELVDLLERFLRKKDHRHPAMAEVGHSTPRDSEQVVSQAGH